MDNIEQEQKKFDQWFIENQKEIYTALRKNTTWDAELGHDVIMDQYIYLKKRINEGLVMTSYPSYFFLGAKFGYIRQQNAKRAINRQRLGEEFAKEIPEEISEETDFSEDIQDYFAKLDTQDEYEQAVLVYLKMKVMNRKITKLKICEMFKINRYQFEKAYQSLKAKLRDDKTLQKYHNFTK